MNVILRAGRAVGATLALTIGLSACAAVAQGVDQGAHQNLGQAVELDVWFEQRFEDGVARSPQFQTSLGRTTNMDQWDDRSDAFAIEGYEISLRDLWDMRAHFDVAALEADDALSYRLFEYRAEAQAAGFPFRNYSYTFNQMFGAQSTAPAFLINQHRITNVAEAEAYIARLNAIAPLFAELITRSDDAFARGVHPPRFVYAHVIRDAENLITGAPFDDGEPSTLLADFSDKVEALDLNDAEHARLIAAARDALTDAVEPAYQNLIAVMERHQELASTDDGVWKLPDGAAYYASRLRNYTTTNLSADEIHDIGLREVDRIHDEMRAIMTEVEYDGTLREFMEFMRTDPQFYYANDDAGRARYLAEATQIVADMRARLDEFFITQPQAEIIVKRVEEFRELSAGKAFYQRPAPDGSRPGTYYANLYDMAQMPTYQMEALAYHEGIPGHHMQISIAQELENVPSFRRFGGYTAYTEGWGLYSEWAPKEMGFYADPYSDFGRLAMELWRAARLVVDTGIHHKRWTREEAIAYLLDNTPNPEGDSTRAIERYIVMPGQATAYMIGKLKLVELRTRAEAALGESFDVRAFHDLILAGGAMPLEMLEQRVDTWIAEQT